MATRALSAPPTDLVSCQTSNRALQSGARSQLHPQDVGSVRSSKEWEVSHAAKTSAHRRRRVEQRRRRHLHRAHAGLGRDDRCAALRDELWRQGGEPGRGRGEARRRRRDGVEGRLRPARRERARQFRGAERRYDPRRPGRGSDDRHRHHPGQSGGREFHPDRQGGERRPCAGRRRGGDGRPQDLRPHPAAARSTARDGLRDARIRQAPWRQDRAEPRPGAPHARSRQSAARELRRAERDRARHFDWPAGHHGGRDRRGGEKPDRGRSSRR